MDIDAIRNQFPMFRNRTEPLIYFDNGATTQKPQAVIDRLVQYYSCENSNIHRGNYPLSNRASTLYEHARTTVQTWLHAKSADEIVFTKGCTESINLAAASAFRSLIGPGDNVIVTELEHSSNYYPWHYHCMQNRVELRTAKANMDGSLPTESVLSLIDHKTKLIAMTAMSNVTGFRPDIKRVISEAHRRQIPVLIDAAQEIAHYPVSVTECDCDFLCFSGHKVYGPMGVGVLYGKQEWLNQMAPYQYGGGMITKLEQGEISYRTDSRKYEAGTQNLGDVLGLEAAFQYLDGLDVNLLWQHEKELSCYLRECLGGINGIHIIGNQGSSPVLSFEADHLGAYDVGVLLANAGISIRCGSHCAYPLMKRRGKESVCRISLAVYNTKQEIDILADRLETICKKGRTIHDKHQ